MSFQQYGGVEIFRPSPSVESAVRARARHHLLSRFTPGEYRGVKEANAVIHHQFGIYEHLLRPLVPKLVSRGAAEFLLLQYDQAWRLLHSEGILDLRQREHWEWIEPRFKRAIKFLLELICMADPQEAQLLVDAREAQTVTETAIACAESMVDLATESDLFHSVFPDECVVRISDSGPYDLTMTIEGRHAGYDRAFSNRVIRDREARNQFVPSPQFDNHTPTHQQLLDEPFREAFGLTYGEFIAALVAIINDAQPSLHPRAFSTLFINRGAVIDELAKSGRPREVIERAIDGFSIMRDRLIADERVVWKPKQESRAYRRGFFVLPHEDGPHLAFCRSMARESLVQLTNWVSYKHLPSEWRTDITEAALEKLSRSAGLWFEGVVRSRFADIGIIGQRGRRAIGAAPTRLAIPDEIGELDFIGFDQQDHLLIVAEAKMVMTGLDAPYWRDDLNEFVLRRGSYAERFRRKLNWVSTEREAICRALSAPRPRGVGGVMLTLYPCIARAFLSDFDCVSITEFMLDWQVHQRWPYRTF